MTLLVEMFKTTCSEVEIKGLIAMMQNRWKHKLHEMDGNGLVSAAITTIGFQFQNDAFLQNLALS